ncbi:MAG: proprotein convertase P-domain-containing protein, partial [Acidimicrobiales bacterium]
PPPPPPPGGTFTNDADVAIPDRGTATSTIDVPLTGPAPVNLQVGVDIAHTYRGDLVVELVAPDGSVYTLKTSNGRDSADNVIGTFTVDASSESRNGTWTLRVRDVFSLDTGTIRSWSLTFP